MRDGEKSGRRPALSFFRGGKERKYQRVSEREREKERGRESDSIRPTSHPRGVKRESDGEGFAPIRMPKSMTGTNLHRKRESERERNEREGGRERERERERVRERKR